MNLFKNNFISYEITYVALKMSLFKKWLVYVLILLRSVADLVLFIHLDGPQIE